MFSKSILWSTLVAFLFFYFVPWGFYTLADACLQEYVLIPTMRENIMPGVLAIGVLLMSFAFVHIFQKWSGGIFSNQKGFIFGLWVALLEVVSIGFIRYATQDAFEAPFYILDSIFWTAMYAIGGVLVAMVSRKTS
ncbi:MAG: hypothetical protein ACPF9U_02790 [Flavobacteriaceae bacterium]